MNDALEAADHREVQLRDVKMDDVELIGALHHLLEHEHVRGEMIPAHRVQPERSSAPWHKCGRRLGIPAGEERHVMPQPYEFIRQKRYNSFGPAIQFRRNTLTQRSDLRNSHLSLPSVKSMRRASEYGPAVPAPITSQTCAAAGMESAKVPWCQGARVPGCRSARCQVPRCRSAKVLRLAKNGDTHLYGKLLN